MGGLDAGSPFSILLHLVRLSLPALMIFILVLISPPFCPVLCFPYCWSAVTCLRLSRPPVNFSVHVKLFYHVVLYTVWSLFHPYHMSYLLRLSQHYVFNSSSALTALLPASPCVVLHAVSESWRFFSWLFSSTHTHTYIQILADDDGDDVENW